MFNYEVEMTAPVVAWLRTTFDIVKDEFATPWGICDLLACKFYSRSIKKRLSLGQRASIGSALNIRVLETIPDEITGRFATFGMIEDVFPIEHRSRIGNSLSKLIQQKFVIQTKSGYQKKNGWAPLQKRLIAVELKLERVEDALRQAKANRFFCSESYVAFPEGMAQKVLTSRERELKQFGIGVISVSQSSCRMLKRSQVNESLVNPTLANHALEKCWRVYIKGSAPLNSSR